MSTERNSLTWERDIIPDAHSLELRAVYEPDEETEACVLLMILGFSSDEIERAVANLDSSPQM